MHDTLARDKNTIPTMSEPKKWHPTKKEEELNGGHMEFIQNMGGFHAHFFFLSGLFLKMKTTKRRGRTFKLIQPFPAQPSSHFMHES
jgi:hypothetical protein